MVDVLGYKPQELLNALCYDYFHPDDLDHMMESYQQGKDCEVEQTNDTCNLMDEQTCPHTSTNKPYLMEGLSLGVI